MTRPNLSSNSSRLTLIGIVLLLAVVGFFIFKKSGNKKPDQTSQTKTSTSNQGQPSAQTKEVSVSATDFSYQKPAGWTSLTQDKLNAQDAVSGIEHSSGLPATFTVAVEAATSSPSNDADVKNSVMGSLNKLPHFELLSITSTTVGGHNGQKFTYTFSNNSKTKQELTVILYKQRAFSLLFAGPDTDFNNQKADFDKILASFKFQ